MSIAKESDIAKFVDEFGPEVCAEPNLPCFYNALRASAVVFRASNIPAGKLELPRIWSVNWEHDGHAYLQHRGLIYNNRITWPNTKYPDFDLITLQMVGADVTTAIWTAAVEELMDPEKFDVGFGAYLRTLFVGDLALQTAAQALTVSYIHEVGEERVLEILQNPSSKYILFQPIALNL